MKLAACERIFHFIWPNRLHYGSWNAWRMLKVIPSSINDTRKRQAFHESEDAPLGCIRWSTLHWGLYWWWVILVVLTSSISRFLPMSLLSSYWTFTCCNRLVTGRHAYKCVDIVRECSIRGRQRAASIDVDCEAARRLAFMSGGRPRSPERLYCPPY